MSENIVLDPEDVQINDIARIATNIPILEEPVSPIVVSLLLQQQKYNLIDLKGVKTALIESQNQKDMILRELFDLKVKNARLEENNIVSWAEIPIGLLGGYALNIVTSSPTNILGWILLGLSAAILIFLRWRKSSVK